MEGLVALVLELILPLSLFLFLLLAELFTLLVGLVQVAVATFAGGWAAARWLAASPAARRVRRAALGLAAVLGLGLILAQTVFFQPIVRRLAAAVESRSGIALAFERASGNLLAGRVVLHEAAARRTSDPAAVFDVRAREMEVDVRLWRLLSGEVALESVRVAGARGSYTRFEGVEKPPRKPYRADALLLEDVEIAWTLRRPDKPDFLLPLRVERLETRPFVAQDAAHAVLFRSNGHGALAGGPFTVAAKDGKATWTGERIPVRLMADFLGEPFDWLSEGTADLVVTDAWTPDGKVDLHWNVRFRDPKAAVPERITGFRRTLAEGMVALINRTPREIPLDFTLTLNGEGFKGSMSLEALELWDALAAAAAAELAEAAGLKPETGKKGLDWIRRFKKRP